MNKDTEIKSLRAKLEAAEKERDRLRDVKWDGITKLEKENESLKAQVNRTSEQSKFINQLSAIEELAEIDSKLGIYRESGDKTKAVDAIKSLKAQVAQKDEALRKLNGFNHRDLTETDLHAYVNMITSEALATSK
jgi:hypothetical protein